MCEIGGDLQSQCDVHYEVKVPSALTKTRVKAGVGLCGIFTFYVLEHLSTG